jgi:hypothetical protein
MNQLLPIIRRVRRPLLPATDPVAVIAMSEPPKTEGETPKAPELANNESNHATDTSNAGAE